MMLNNDTQVEDYWLDNLLQTFIDFPKSGIVGSKLIYRWNFARSRRDNLERWKCLELEDIKMRKIQYLIMREKLIIVQEQQL